MKKNQTRKKEEAQKREMYKPQYLKDYTMK